MKKLLVCFLAITIISMGYSSPAQAKVKEVNLDSLSNTEVNQLADSNFKSMEASINKMSDKEFDDFITKFIKDEANQNDAKEKLSKIGVSVNFQEENQAIGIQSIPSSAITLTTYSAHRGHDPYYRLFCSFSTIETESRPATKDVLGLYFNSNMADYYQSNQSDTRYVNLKDSSQFMNGTILFNVDDSRLNWATDTQYAAIYVIPKSSGYFLYGGKYAHTYNTTKTTTSGSASVSFSGSGVSGSVGFSVNTSIHEACWEKSSDNGITW